MSEINLSDVTPILLRRSLKDEETTCSTLREELPKRIKGPIIVTTEIFGVKSTRTYKPIDPKYNLE